MKKSIAEHMKDILEENEEDVVWYGSLDRIHECATRAGMYERGSSRSQHPLNINNRVLSALDKSPFFEKGYIKYVGRPSRKFTLIEQESPYSESTE